MKTLVTALLLLSLSSGYAAGTEKYTKPDLVLIKKEIKDSRSLHYYPYLYTRYLGDDTTLTMEDYRYLYYGSAYQVSSDTAPDYKHDSARRDSVNAILGRDTLLTADYLELIGYYKESLRRDPFSIKSISRLTTAYRKTGQTDQYRKYHYKLNTLLDAIESTGDGRSVASAYYVTDVSHEYELLWAFGLRFGGSQSLVGDMDCDYLTVMDNKYKIEGMYFNVGISMAKLSEVLGGSGQLSLPKGKRKKK